MSECIEMPEDQDVERYERAKKLYRYISDVSRRIDEATASSSKNTDLFTTKLEVLRHKLRDNCEKLMFLDPLNYGKKSLELLWRKVYYETVSAAKKHKEPESEYDNYLFTHIVSGIGQLHHFIARIQSDMKVHLEELDYCLINNDNDGDKDELKKTDNDTLICGKSLIHSCLVYLGDLCRYQAEIFHTFDASLAARYYLQALHVDTSAGMPYNQLGNLYLDKNHNLDSACHYIHCLSCPSPFEGAAGNLEKLFEKNNLFVQTIPNSEGLSQTEHVQITLANFLSLIDSWYYGKSDEDVPQRCNMIAQQLKIGLDFAPAALPDIGKDYNEHMLALEEENLNPSFFSTETVHKITLICLFTISKVSETDEKKAFACKAFTLAVFSQLLTKLLQQLKSLGFRNPADIYYKHPRSEPEDRPESPPDADEVIEPPELVEIDPAVLDEADRAMQTQTQSEDELPDLINGDAKSKKSLAKRRRRRRTDSTDTSEASDTESESEGEHSCSDAEAISECSLDTEEEAELKGGATTDEVIETEPLLEAEETVKIDNDAPKISTNGVKEDREPTKEDDIRELDPTEIDHFLHGNNFLPSIKLLQDWLLTEKELILSCGEGGESLFQCVVDITNTLTFHFTPKNNNELATCEALQLARAAVKRLELEYRTVPLPEDLNLRGTNICRFDKDAAEWRPPHRHRPTELDENVIRILDVIEFGSQLASLVPRIRFNRSMQIYYLKRFPTPKVSTKLSHKRTREWHNSKTPHPDAADGGLLRRLGRLWLTARVRELERYRRAAPPSLLVLDAAALRLHLKRVKQLLRTKIFILLIPTVVLRELDELKRAEAGARDAIRWLETQLAGGSRLVRAQRPGQSAALPSRTPRRAPPHVLNYIQVLEFCHHLLSEAGGSGDADPAPSAPLLVLLTGAAAHEEVKDFSPLGAACAAGVKVEHIANFHTKHERKEKKERKKR